MWSPSRNRRTEGAEFRSEHGWHHESRRFRPVEGDESAFLRPNLRPLNPPPPGRGRRPRAASLAPSGQFTFCPHRPVLFQADAPSIQPLFVSDFLSSLRRAPRWFPPRGKAAAAYATNVPLARLLYAAVSISPLPGPHLWNLPQVVLPIAHRSVWGHGKKRPAHSEKPCAGRFFWAACPV